MGGGKRSMEMKRCKFLDGIGGMGAEAAKANEHDKAPQTTGTVPSGG